MKKVQLKGTDLAVSRLGLGTANYGTSLSREEAFEQLDRYTEAGNLIDTARVYGDWVPGEVARSEKVIGEWLASRGKRDSLVISTKGAHPPIGNMGQSRVTPGEIVSDLEGSLKSLQTDHVDLYFLHRDHKDQPVEALMDCLEGQRRAGKIRYYGCSNWSLPRIIAANAYAADMGYSGFVCNQLLWSLAQPDTDKLSDKTLVYMDAMTLAHHRETGLNAFAYTAQAKGYFTSLDKGLELKPGVKSVYDTPENQRRSAALRALSNESGLPVTTLTLLYFAAQPFAAVPLASFSKQAQLQEALAFLKGDYPEAVIRRLGEIPAPPA